MLPTRTEWRQSAAPIARGSVVGFITGLVPGPAAVLSTFIAYALEKKLSRTPERFGHGAIEGVAGPEAANNAATAGAMVPLLSLGIPFSPATAILLGALVIHGLQPGPLLIGQRPDRTAASTRTAAASARASWRVSGRPSRADQARVCSSSVSIASATRPAFQRGPQHRSLASHRHDPLLL